MAVRVCAENSGSGAKPDVLLVADNGHSGGIGRYCVDLAQAMRGSASIACLCPEQCSGESRCWLADQCRVRGLPLFSIAMATKAWIQGLHGLSAVWQAAGRPIVHVNGRRGNFIATLARHWFPEFTFATTVHGVLGLNARRNAAYRVVDLGASHAANAVIAVSADTRRRLVADGVPSEKILVVTNGLGLDALDRLTAVADARGFSSQPARSLRVGYLGRLGREKGIEEFGRLAQILLAEGTAATFAVVGDGPLRAAFLEQSKTLIASGRLEYLGDVSDPIPILGAVDVLVMPSHNEGLPYVLLEAMAAGCAIVAYGVGGIPEVVVDDALGRLVRPDDFSGLVAAVSYLVAQPSVAKAIGKRASAHVRERFSLSQRLPLLSKAYEMCGLERAASITNSYRCREDGDGCVR